MMIETICWWALAAVHAMPALAFFRPATLSALYRLESGNPLFLLMHHRAAFFVAVFALCIWSAFDPAPRPAALLVTGISMLSFLLLYFAKGSPKPLKAIARVDLIGLPFLIYAAWEVLTK